MPWTVLVAKRVGKLSKRVERVHGAVNKWVGMGARALSANRYGKRVRLGNTGWELVQSEEGGGTPTMGAVGEMGGERRLGWA